MVYLTKLSNVVSFPFFILTFGQHKFLLVSCYQQALKKAFKKFVQTSTIKLCFFMLRTRLKYINIYGC